MAAADRLAQRLRDLGFNEEEADIYVFLSAMGPTPARIIARRFNSNRMKVYRNLKALEERSLLQRVMGRPVKFVAMPLKNVLARQKDGLRKRLTDLEGSEETLLKEWENLARGVSSMPEEPRFRIFQGRQQVFNILFEMYDRTDVGIRLVTTVSDLARLSLWGLDDRLRAMSKQGKKIMLLTQIDSENLKEVEQYLDFVEARHITLQTPIRFAIIDEKEALTTVAMDDSMSMTTQADTGLWTDAPNYVAAMKIFFDALWSLAPDAESFIKSIKTGEPTQEMKTYSNPEDFASLFKEMIQRGTQRIDVIAKSTASLPISLRELEEVSRRGVRVRILTVIDENNIDEIYAIKDPNMVVVENTAVTDLILVTVDEKEVLLNIPYAGASKRTVWSNIVPYVMTMMQVYQDYWKLGKPVQERLQQLIEHKRAEALAQRVKTELETRGWRAEAPGALMGVSGKSYSFDVLAKHAAKGETPLCIDILTEGPAFNTIIEHSAIYTDVASRLILASLKPLKAEEKRLADLYRIQAIYSETEEGLVSAILSTVDKAKK
jgi:sugar-specific transcriptional regulator TrmB